VELQLVSASINPSFLALPPLPHTPTHYDEHNDTHATIVNTAFGFDLHMHTIHPGRPIITLANTYALTPSVPHIHQGSVVVSINKEKCMSPLDITRALAVFPNVIQLEFGDPQRRTLRSYIAHRNIRDVQISRHTEPGAIEFFFAPPSHPLQSILGGAFICSFDTAALAPTSPLEIGDQVLRVNQHDVTLCSKAEFQAIFAQCRVDQPVSLTVISNINGLLLAVHPEAQSAFFADSVS
jgi:hypothetical protein